jgi:Na+-transporting NADH:ubiquinone oxidoreductase subunit B
MDAKVEFPQTALAAGGRAAQLPRRWTGDRVTSIFAMALAFPLAARLYESGTAFLPLLAGSLVVAVGWTLLFTRLRGKDMNWHAMPTAIVFALLVPPDVPLWQALLSLSFGLVLGEQVFGGRGYSFLNPAVAALAFLFFSFPAASLGQADSQLVALAVAPGALLLLASGLISWRILLAAAAGFIGWMGLKGLGLPSPELLTASLALGLVHLIAEPTSATATNPGRWAYGLLAGALLVILGDAGQGIGSTAPVVFAALLASVFAPLIDRIVVLVNVNRRRRRTWPT